ncbi:MAG: O-antigen ligase family protein [Acidobacteriota bacterium]|nr:O-antigen ligase family protein [Acidobacteriota bacterium]
MTPAAPISWNQTFWNQTFWNEPVRRENPARGLSGFGRIAFGFLWLFIFTLPGEKVLELPGIGTISRLAGLVAIGAGVLAIVEARRFRLPAPAHLAMAAFIVWSAFTYSWSFAPEWTQEKIYTYFQLFAMAWLIWELGRDDREQRLLMQAYVLGTFVSSADTIANYAVRHQTYYLRYATTGFDPNDLGLTLALSLPLSYYLALRSTGAMVWIYRLQSAAAIFTILLTASRAAWIASIVGLALVPWTFGVLSRKTRVLTVALGLILLAASVSFIPASSWKRIATIHSEVSEGTLNKRTMIWGAGLTVLRERPFRGVGVGAFPAAVESILGTETGMTFVAHNSFLSVLVESGAVGFLCFFALLGVLALSLLDLRSLEAKLWIVMLAAWAIGVSTLTWEHRKPTWLLFSLLTAQWGTASRLLSTGGGG